MDTIEEIKQKLDIVEIISSYTNLQKSGRNFRALCPFHSEKTPSFFVFPEKQSWHCFGACGTGGDIFSFIMKKEGFDFGHALTLLAGKAGVNLSRIEKKDEESEQGKNRLIEINETATSYYHHLLCNTLVGQNARDYLKNRGISAEIINKFSLGFSPDSFEETSKYLLSKNFQQNELYAAGLVLKRDNGTFYDRFRNRLMFPIKSIRGNTIGFGARVLDDSLPKYLNSPQTIVFDKSSSLYAIDKAKETIQKKDYVIIMEGYMDVLTAHQFGYENAVASMGTAIGDRQLALLKKLTRNIFIALDCDTAGKEADLRTAETLPFAENILSVDDNNDIFNYHVRVIVPAQGKDPDEQIRRNPAEWSQSIEKAQPIMSFVVSTAKEKIASGDINTKALITDNLLQFVSKIENSIVRGHYIQEIARIIKMRPSELSDEVNSIRRKSKRKNVKHFTDIRSNADLVLSYCQIEEYCLSLLIRFPELREEATVLNQNYFEHDENKEIFIKWQLSKDQTSLKNNLDSFLHPHLDRLLKRSFPPAIADSEDKRREDLLECIIRLREKLFKSLAAKKAEILATEAEFGGNSADIIKLEEQGIEESIKLKQNFTEQNRRRRSIV